MDSPAEERNVWTNANSGEVLPDVVTPLTWSSVEYMVTTMFGAIFGRIGLDLGGRPAIGLVAGRAYFNVSTLSGMLRCFAFIREMSVSEVLGGKKIRPVGLDESHVAGLGEALVSKDTPEVKLNRLKLLLNAPGLLRWVAAHSPERGELFVAGKRRGTEGLARLDCRRLSEGELLRRARDAAHDLIGHADVLMFPITAMCWYMFLSMACRRWLGDEDAALARRLVGGLDGMQPAEAGLEMWRLAALAHHHPGVEAVVLSGEVWEKTRERIAGEKGGEEFLARWRAFMAEHGHHTRGELEYANPRWCERPDHVLGLVRGYLPGCQATSEGPDAAQRGAGGKSPLARHAELARERRRLTVECRARLRNPLKRAAFEILLANAQRGSVVRENVKSEAVRRLTLVRFMLLALADRLVGRGVFRQRDDIFFLSFAEIEPAISGGAEFDVSATIAERRAEHEKNLTITPPSVVVGRFDPDDFVPDPVDRDVRALRGVAASPGVATGPARVILRAGSEQVRPGEVLVAPFTDPGWTPYFLNAAGIVMDMGGLLSHGSIIAREYGIPAVVNVGPATRMVKSGQMLCVDGDRGVVEILQAGRAGKARLSAQGH
jgi:pyruvate,water dikinase